MIELTRRWPGKRSRTSTQAVIVPRTALIRATTAAAPRLSLSASIAPGLVTTSQKLVAPSARDSQTNAAIGRMTTTDRNAVTKPSERPVCAFSLARLARGEATEAVLASGASDRLFDAGHQAALGIEPALVDLPPAAEPRAVDPDQRPRRELRPVLLRHRLQHRPIARLREQALRRRRLREGDELLDQVEVRARLDRRDRELDQHRLRRDEVGDVLACL